MTNMLHLATMDEWWALTRKYPEYRRPSHALLKDYGYLKLFEALEELEDSRVLEFGHGFNHSLLSRFQDQLEMHGVDEHQGLPYFPERNEWEALYVEHITKLCPRCALHRGLLGEPDRFDLENSSFDLIASVSVLEELPYDTLRKVVEHAVALLKPGGILAGTFDVQLNQLDGVRSFVRILRELDMEVAVDLPEGTQHCSDGLLLESPSTVMLTYYMSQGEDRTFRGHWASVWFSAVKPINARLETKNTNASLISPAKVSR